MKTRKTWLLHRIQNYIVTLSFPTFLLISCSENDRLAPEGVQKEFEKDSGFKVPASATGFEGLIGEVDFHGDYAMAVTFVVPPAEVAAFFTLAPFTWLRAEDFKPLKAAKYIGRDVSLPFNSKYQMPAGALFINQSGPGDVNRQFAVDSSTGKIVYARQTW